jgi:sirohydrochlorin ferrochelatase
VSIEESFAKLIGRPPTEKERLRLSHIREALDVRDNDALWAIIMAYELYDSLFAAYPAQIAEEAKQIMERARETYAAAAEAPKDESSARRASQYWRRQHVVPDAIMGIRGSAG